MRVVQLSNVASDGVVRRLAGATEGKDQVLAICVGDLSGPAGVVRFYGARKGEVGHSWDWKIGPIGGLAFCHDGDSCAADGTESRAID